MEEGDRVRIMIKKVFLSVTCLAISGFIPVYFAQETKTIERKVIIGGPGGGSFLGVGVADVDAERAKALKLSEERGVEVKNVEPDSPAAKAGIKEGDVVLDYNGQRIEGTQQFIRMVRETPPGRIVKLSISRGGSVSSVTATLGKRAGREFAWHSAEGDNLRFHVPAVPPMPPMAPGPHVREFNIEIPDVPRPNMAWRTGRLGVEGESLSSQLAEFFGVKEGVLIRSVVKDSPAEKGGIKAGDVITKVDGETVTNAQELSSEIRSKRTKKTFPITLVRGKKEMSVTVTLEDPSPGGGDRIRTAAPEHEEVAFRHYAEALREQSQKQRQQVEELRRQMEKLRHTEEFI